MAINRCTSPKLQSAVETFEHSTSWTDVQNYIKAPKVLKPTNKEKNLIKPWVINSPMLPPSLKLSTYIKITQQS